MKNTLAATGKVVLTVELPAVEAVASRFAI
jgi:hypothetical protein